jgi:glutathione S-transferase
MAEYRLYHCDRSRSVRVRWMLEECGADYTLISMPLEHTRVGGEAYKAIHPLQKIPTLDFAGGRIFESMAALQFLAERHKPSFRLAPDHPDYAAFLQWTHFAEGTMGQYVNQFIGHTMVLPEAMRRPAIAQWAAGEIGKCMSLFSDQLGYRPFALGDALTLVDLGMGYHCYLLKLFRLMSDMPENIQAYWKMLAAREAFQRACAITAAA